MATTDPSSVTTVDVRRRDVVPAAIAQDANAEVAVPPQPGQGGEGRDYWGIAKTLMGRAIMMYVITTWIGGRGNKSPATTTTTAPDGSQIIVTHGHNVYSHLMPMDMYAYVNERPKYHKFDEENLVWREDGLQYGDWSSGASKDGSYSFSTELPISENVQTNKSNLYLHVYFVQAGASPRPADPNYNAGFTVHKTIQLNKLKKVSIGPKKQNLLTGETANPRAVELNDSTPQPSVMMSHWHPNLTINLLDDHTAWMKGKAPSPVGDYLEFNTDGNYLPILYFNDYWNLNKDYQPINETVQKVNLTLTYHPLSLFRWQLYVSQSMSNKWSKMLNGDIFQSEGGDENLITDENDTIKEALLDTNPILLGLTVVVSLFHTVFEFMAFKNDIQFWKNKGEDLEGLSVRSVFLNVVQSVIVLLYVMDNDTNPMVRFSIAIGLAIEIWKVKKVMNVRVDYNNKIFGLFPRVWLEDKKSYVESSTRKYDKMAFKYLSWAFFPLVLCYGVYSLLYEEHKGWYSWVLGMLYGFLLTFGFISMTPQLFINYKLKSVAHLPWRMMTYKALNTFIDDIFAFVIKMPTMYRIGCLRDDVIFFIFLYQRWIYRVDPSRMNEYGYSQEMIDRHGVVAVNQHEEVTRALGVDEITGAPTDEHGSVSSDVEREDSAATEVDQAPADQSVRKRKSKASRVRKEE